MSSKGKKGSSKVEKGTPKKSEEKKDSVTDSSERGVSAKKQTPQIGFMGIGVKMPVRVTPKAKEHLRELQSSGKIKKDATGKIIRKSRVLDDENRFGIMVEEEGETLSVAITHPVIPTSAIVPRHREQGDITLRRRTRRIAERLRKKRTRKGRKG